MKYSNHGLIERFAHLVTRATGSNTAFIVALVGVIAWGAAGPAFHFSSNWQWLINTSTTTITFLMVFLIQKTQNKDSLAIQLKLNELLSAHETASDDLVDSENMSEEELKVIQKYYAHLKEKKLKRQNKKPSTK
jgi:low affinity Fe/Cu permease